MSLNRLVVLSTLMMMAISTQAWAAEEASKFKIEGTAGEQILTDAESSLGWQKDHKDGLNWDQAKTYCSELKYGGKDDWRLPDRRELMTIVKYRKSNPASDFPGMPAKYFWSESTSAEYSGFAWGVNFRNGSLNNYDKASTQLVRCVRKD